jgi:hypothetical protein
MQATSSLSFRALANKIHPQLPLTGRESSQLLTLLTTSFQQNLDRHHPAGSQHTEHSSLSELSSSPALDSPRHHHHSSRITQPNSHHSTDAHLRHVLSSPLLARKPRALSLSKSDTAQGPNVQKAEDNPLEWLHERIASAAVRLEDVSLCLDKIWLQSCPPAFSLHDQSVLIQKLKPAAKIISWLRASGRIPEGMLLVRKHPHKNSRAYILATMLVIEGRQDIILGWLRSREQDLIRLRPLLLYHYLRAEIERGTGLEHAMKVTIRLIFDVPTVNGKTTSGIWNAIFPKLKNHAHSVSADTYNSFANQFMHWSHNPLRDAALFAIFHPVAPSYEKGLEYVNMLSAMSVPETDALAATAKRVHVEFCLELAKVLIAEQQHESANFVLHFTQDRFPTQVGSQSGAKADPMTTENRTKRLEDELANVQQLNGLFAV